MHILILEDDAAKLQALRDHISQGYPQAKIQAVGTFTEYLKELNREVYDFLVLDLVVPRRPGNDDPVDITEIVEATRGDYKCQNFRTPGLVLTGYDQKAEDNFRVLNQHDFAVITYAQDNADWKAALDRKIATLPSRAHFDFVIVCALEKEAKGFSEAGFQLGDHQLHAGLRWQTIQVGTRTGALVTAPRMGLVTAAITASQAILSFEPQLICMSGICGGVPGEAAIYDVVIAETCHQHDTGKWSDGKLKPEIYSVAIDHQFAQKVRAAIGGRQFLEKVLRGILSQRDELPDGIAALTSSVRMAPASSGSAVLGDEQVVAQISEQQRKSAIFEMESYAIYEAARLSPLQPKYFSAKAVVDDGGSEKSDKFHRIGCMLSARVVGELVELFDFT